MKDYILLMHGDVTGEISSTMWSRYLDDLRGAGVFQGGSAIGLGEAVRKGRAAPLSSHLTGYIRITATDMEQAKTYVVGNPAYERGGTVEIRELPRE